MFSVLYLFPQWAGEKSPFCRYEQPVADTLVVQLAVVVREILRHGTPQVTFTKGYQLAQALRIAVALTEAQMTAHGELDQPIAELVGKARRRPLTQAEFFRLMQLLALGDAGQAPHGRATRPRKPCTSPHNAKECHIGRLG